MRQPQLCSLIYRVIEWASDYGNIEGGNTKLNPGDCFCILKELGTCKLVEDYPMVTLLKENV